MSNVTVLISCVRPPVLIIPQITKIPSIFNSLSTYIHDMADPAEDFTFNEYADMQLIYGEVRQNSRAAVRLWRERFPNRRLPNRQTFSNVDRRLREFGNFRGYGGDRGRPAAEGAAQRDDEILAMLAEDPTLSVRQISHYLGISVSTVWRVINRETMHPYHFTRVAALRPGDFAQRVRFCEWILQMNEEHLDFFEKVLFTDESSFSRNGITNLRNMHYWAIENPHLYRAVHFQDRFSINVWTGILGDQLAGPFLMPIRLNGRNYLNFLRNQVEDFLDDLPLARRFDVWYLHDGAPPHIQHDVVNYLNNEYGAHWIGRNGPVSWPPRSPDLNPLDFYFWGHVKTIVYNTPIPNVDELWGRVQLAANQIRNRNGLLEHVRASLVRRARACIQQNGDRFEHLL